MNILLLCYEYPPIGGGGGVGAKQYADAWAQRGHTVTVLTSWARGLSFREQIEGVDIIRVRTIMRTGRATATILSMLSYIVVGSMHVMRHKRAFRNAQIVNTHFAIPTGPLGLLVSRILGIPNVLTIIGGDIYDPTKRSSPHRHVVTKWINSSIMNAADGIIAISNDTKGRAETYYTINKEIRIINYGFIPPMLAPPKHVQLSRDHGQYYLISIGRLIKRKGFEYLIQCMPLLPRNVVLIIVGDGPMEADLRELARTRGVDDRVIFTGYVPRAQIYEYLQNADCFVLPSLHEGLGIVVQEAMHVGLPIVCTDNGGQTDLVKEPRNGILVKPGYIGELTGAITRFYLDRELRGQVAENNKEDIKIYYMAVNCEEYLSLFEELIGGAAAMRLERKPASVNTVTTGKGEAATRMWVGKTGKG